MYLKRFRWRARIMGSFFTLILSERDERNIDLKYIYFRAEKSLSLKTELLDEKKKRKKNLFISKLQKAVTQKSTIDLSPTKTERLKAFHASPQTSCQERGARFVFLPLIWENLFRLCCSARCRRWCQHGPFKLMDGAWCT